MAATLAPDPFPFGLSLSKPRRRGLLLAAVGLLAVPLLPGCGFQRRQPAKLAFASIALQGFAAGSSLALQLRRELQKQVRVLDDAAQAAVVLHALDDRRDRSVVAQTAAAQVRDLQLRVVLRFRVSTPAGRELLPRAELMTKRELSYSETAALAKEAEEAELYREMQTDVVAQVMRRLATVVL